MRLLIDYDRSLLAFPNLWLHREKTMSLLLSPERESQAGFSKENTIIDNFAEQSLADDTFLLLRASYDLWEYRADRITGEVKFYFVSSSLSFYSKITFVCINRVWKTSFWIGCGMNFKQHPILFLFAKFRWLCIMI